MKRISLILLLLGLSGCVSVVEVAEITAAHPASHSAEIGVYKIPSRVWEIDPVANITAAEEQTEISNHDKHKMHNMDNMKHDQ